MDCYLDLGSSAEFEAFYQKNAKKVRGLLFRLVGEGPLNDLTQEAFMKAWEHRHQFKGGSEASTWLYRIAFNCALDYKRRFKLREKEEAPVNLVEASIEHSVSNRELVEKALMNLDLDHRATVTLFYLEDLSVKEVSQSLGVAEGTVKSRLSHARERMSEFLTKRGVVAHE